MKSSKLSNSQLWDPSLHVFVTRPVDQAQATIRALPLAANGFLGFEFIPVRPLKPLGLLIQGK